jgi:hypothetical protein
MFGLFGRFMLLVMALLRLFGQAFVSDNYQLPTLRTQTWVIPRFGYQVGTHLGFVPCLTEGSILSAS